MNEKVYMLLWVSLAIIAPFFIAYTVLLFSKAGQMVEGSKGSEGLYVASEVFDIGTGSFLSFFIAILIMSKSIFQNRKKLRTEICISSVLFCMVAANAFCLYWLR